MINPTAYSAPVIGYQPVPAQKSAALEAAAAAADFERILNAPAPVRPDPAESAASPKTEDHSFLGFIKDIIDIINPLQHLPVVGAIYRHVTGDEIGPMARLVGDTLYGGPIGGAVAVADLTFEQVTGKDFGETVIAGLTGGDETPADAEPTTAIAQNLNNNISPAAGEPKTISASEIIWANNITPASPLFLPPAQHTGTRRAEPVHTPTPTPSVLPTKGTASTTVLQAQEAPAGMARTAVPPELIAAKMMEALDKYAEMKRPQMASTVSIAR